MDIRTFLGIKDKPYAKFVREERHLTAILFHALNLKGNLRRFVEAIECPDLLSSAYDPATYYEFSFLRDAWNQIESNDVKRSLIETSLPKCALPEEGGVMPLAFNTHFGVSGNASKDHIQSPGRWSMAKFDENIKKTEAFKATCLFKWSFNAKPDLVIQTSRNQCICIEAKLGSGEANYPVSNKEKAIFKKRNLGPIRQTQVQAYLMQDLLGFEVEHFFLSMRGKEKSPVFRAVAWDKVFGAMSLKSLPDQMKLTLREKFGVLA